MHGHKRDIEARDKFLFTLEWILAVSRRYPGSLYFGLAHISVGSSQAVGNAYGAQEGSRKLIEVCEALRKCFRKADLVARDGVDYWVLAPYTPASENITDRIVGIIEEASRNGLDIVDRNITVFSSLPLKLQQHVEDRSALGFLRGIKSLCVAHDCELLCDPTLCRKVSIQAG